MRHKGIMPCCAETVPRQKALCVCNKIQGGIGMKMKFSRRTSGRKEW